MLYFSPWKRFLVWLVVVAGLLVGLPNFLPQSVLNSLPQWYAGVHVPMGIDLQGGSRLVVQFPDDDTARKYRDKTINVMTRRIYNLDADLRDFTIVAQGRNQIRIEVPGLFNVQLLKDIISVTARLEVVAEDKNVVADDVITGKIVLPAGDLLVYSEEDPPTGYVVHKTPLLTNDNIVNAVAESADANADTATLTLTFDEEGRRKIEQFRQGAGEKRLLAMFDGQVVGPMPDDVKNSYLRIDNIDRGVAQNLATVLSTGALPTDVSFIEERTIGADFGVDYAKAGLYAAIGAVVVVALFMLLAYGFLGLLADIALAVNIVILMAVLSLVGTPLSLAGFAGLVLIIGVSVDANILIFERIREDRRHGYSLTQAVVSGFSGALATIMDANITTLIAALVLFLLGVGPIHGFALVVSIGIVTSLFTTITFTRMMMSWWIKVVKPMELPRGFMRLVAINSRIGFMHLRSFTLGLAGILIILIVVLYSTTGINYGIDFKGGSLVVLDAKNGAADIYDIENRAMGLNVLDAGVEASKKPSQAFLSIPNQGLGEDAEQSARIKVANEFSDDYRLERVDVVGPTISDELSRASLLAVIISLIAIFVYVLVRFSWQFAVGAVVTTIHDIIILAGVFIITDWQFNLWSIAAVLAIIGYSLNDTIVVYDRVRQLLARGGDITMKELVDLAINRTLSRTIMTSLATLIAHIPLYYFGGIDMRNFASVLLLGILIGTYSSIFIAGPFLVLLGVRSKSVPVEKV